MLAFLSASSFAQEIGFVDLFNGKNLDGWTQRNGTATYRVEDDAIVGKTNEGAPIPFFVPIRCMAILNCTLT
ncbi:MAG: family 16 glycoside hydrolase [Pirellulaceae bacterium]